MTGMQITGWVITFDIIFMLGGCVAGYLLRPKIDKLLRR